MTRHYYCVMTRPVSSDLLLVGSLPADSTEGAFRSAAGFFSGLVFALPDGETGPRAGWVSYERERLARPNPGVVVVQETESPTGLPRHANSGRAVDWLHLAGPRYLRSEDRSFFRPLADLEPGDARVFLGIVLPIDGAPGLCRRHATASRYLRDFGVAMYCGFGRQPGRDGIETMREHAEAAGLARSLGAAG
jgi:hypothetical protein